VIHISFVLNQEKTVQTIKTPEDYYSLVDQAVFEVEDLRAAIEYESIGLEGALDYLQVLEQELNHLKQAFKQGDPVFGERDLKYIKLIKDRDMHELPFRGLLLTINRIYREGLEVDNP